MMVIFCTGAECGLQRRDQRMADLVVGDDLLFLVGEHGVLLLIAGDDDLHALLQICLVTTVAPIAHRAQGRLVDDVGQLRAGGAGGHTGDGVEVDVVPPA